MKDEAASLRALQNLVRKVEATGYGALALEERESSNGVIGWCGIQPMRDFNEFEVTYALRKDRWGNGLALEAASALLGRAFDGLRLGRIYGLVFPQNARSIRVLEKLGMTFVKQHLDETTQRDAWLYSIDYATFLTRQSSSK
jgi:RimJ/RimL family protein N-acetyltransferase